MGGNSPARATTSGPPAPLPILVGELRLCPNCREDVPEQLISGVCSAALRSFAVIIPMPPTPVAPRFPVDRPFLAAGWRNPQRIGRILERRGCGHHGHQGHVRARTNDAARSGIGAAILAGTAEHVLLGGGVGTLPGSVALEFDISQTHPLVTLVSRGS